MYYTLYVIYQNLAFA